MINSFYGDVWAKEFCATVKRIQGVDLDEGWMTGWFCNAIMRGYDEQNLEKELLVNFIKSLPNFKSLELSVKIASELNVCRICKEDCAMPTGFNFESEHAHRECLNKGV